MHEELPLVVVGAAAPDAAVGHHGLERLGAPLLARIDGHDVVVTVYEHRARLRIDDLLGIYHRIALRGQHFRTVGSRLHEACGQMFGAAHHVGLVLRLCADRGDAQHFEQVVQKALSVLRDVIRYFFHIKNWLFVVFPYRQRPNLSTGLHPAYRKRLLRRRFLASATPELRSALRSAYRKRLFLPICCSPARICGPAAAFRFEPHG